jgi:hypothetical protein
VVIASEDWAIRRLTFYVRAIKSLAGYGRVSQTERELVDDEGIASLSLLKVQSDPLGNLGDSSGDEIDTC